MKVSIVIAILNSHEVVRRQILHFGKMNLPKDVEVIFIDDGSNPPLSFQSNGFNLSMYYTNDKRPWTQGLARNAGALIAKGEYLFFTDIDHIITKEAINDVLKFEGDIMIFPRYFGILDENGDIVCDVQSMLDFGLNPARLTGYRMKRNKEPGSVLAGIHSNTYAVRKTIFEKIGGYERHLCDRGFHMGGIYKSEECRFNGKYNVLIGKGEAGDRVEGSRIYCYPVSKFRTDGSNNPFGLFHDLSLEQVPQPMMK
jgi:glycosyltransferase involved in cell wall biosynthesis